MITQQPSEPNKAYRIRYMGTGKGETDQGLMFWMEIDLTDIPWQETLIISAWNDKTVVGPHFEIASCSEGALGGVTRPIIFYMNTENPRKHVEALRINADGSVVVHGKVTAADFEKSK